MKNNSNDLSRRSFVAASVAGSALAASARSIAAARVPRVIGANDRLHIGMIGAGGNATGHMKRLIEIQEAENTEIIAVCDIYQKRLDAAAELTGGKPYHDYRRLLENPDIDYVVISVPEHWHAQMTLDAVDAGKHIYCEKPMTYNIEEAKRVRDRVKQSNIKMQVGVQGMSDDSYETAQRYIKDGKIGKVVMAQIDYSRNHLDDFWARPYDDDVRPRENLDWDAFLGPARKRPFDPDRFFAWRRYWDYSGGIASDLFVHRITRIIKACNLTVPSRVVATGGQNFFRDSAAEIPDTFNMMVDYPEGVSVLLVSSMANAAKIRHIIRGHEGTLEFHERGLHDHAGAAVRQGVRARRRQGRRRGMPAHPSRQDRRRGHSPAPRQPSPGDPLQRASQVRRGSRFLRCARLLDGGRVVAQEALSRLGRAPGKGGQGIVFTGVLLAMALAKALSRCNPHRPVRCCGFL